MQPDFRTPVVLSHALREILGHPLRTLIPPWSWKAAAFAATVRGFAFFVTNVQSGSVQATKAFLVEAFFAFVAGGAIGAISQQLRRAEPLWATATVVWIGLPGVMLLAQSCVHRLAHTPHLGGGLFVSLVLAAFASAFSWYAMRNGAMLGGSEETTLAHDFKVLPKIFVKFIVAGPKHAANALGKATRL